MAAAYAVELDQQSARHYADTGATILLLDVPEATHIAFDHQGFVVGPKFKGVKMLPPGPHMVSYNAASRTGDFAPTISFFAHMETREVLIRRWDAVQELLIELSPDEVEAYTAGVRRFDFDQHLAPYNLSVYQQWQNLASFISKSCIARLSPLPSGNISITAEADPALLRPVTAAEQKLYTQLQEGRTQAGQSGNPSMEVDGHQAPPSVQPEADRATNGAQESDLRAQEGVGRCYYTQLPRLVKVPGMTPQQLTALNLDKTAVLDDLIQRCYSSKPNELLGEMQFSFLAFLMGHSLEGFAQWKAILHLLLGCQEGPLKTHVPFFNQFLQALYSQLQHSLPQQPEPVAAQGNPDAAPAMPFGMPVVEELLADSFLQQLFGQFFQVLHEEGRVVQPKLKAVSSQLQMLLRQKLGWEFDLEEVEDEDDEYAPAVVQLDEAHL